MIDFIPTPDVLPVGWVWFQALLMVVFPVHLLFMNAMLGFIAAALILVRGDEDSRRLSSELAKIVPFLIAFAVNFGVASLLFLQVLYGHFLYTSSVLMAVFWLSVIPLLITGYYGVYALDARFMKWSSSRSLLLGLVFLLFLAIAFIFSNNMTLMLDPQRWSAYFTNDGGTLLNLSEPSLVPRYLHMITGGIAVGGIFVALYGKWREKRDVALGARAAHVGMGLFKWLTLLQLPIGIWLLLALPREIMMVFMGKSIFATILFSLSLLLTAAALVAAFRKSYHHAMVIAVILVFAMAFMRDFVRSAWIGKVFTPASVLVEAQYSPLILFLVSLSLGVPVVVWLIAKARSSFRQP